jgi:hypothetical protein
MEQGVTRVYYDILTGLDLSESEILYTVRFFNAFLQYCSFEVGYFVLDEKIMCLDFQ